LNVEKLIEFLKTINELNPDVVKMSLPAGEYIYVGDDFIYYYFLGHCAKCGAVIGSTEGWQEDSDHCISCENERLKEEIKELQSQIGATELS
jgi:hypothetical protein